jgi:hypothetical protein
VFIRAELPSGLVTGSGVIISSDGYILTAAQIVYEAKQIQVLISEKNWHNASLVTIHPKWRPSRDGPSGDVALLKVVGDNLPALSFGDSNQLEYDEEIRVLGYPLPEIGWGFIAVAGTVQGMRTTQEGVQLIQHTAPSNFGHLGGPVVNRHGEIVGIETTAIGTEWSRFGLAIAMISVWEAIPISVVTFGYPRPEGIKGPRPLPLPPLSGANISLVHTFVPPNAQRFRSEHVALTSDGQLLATTVRKGGKSVITLWDTNSGRMVREISTEQTAHSWDLAFSHDGSLIAYSTEDGMIGIWEVSTGSSLPPIHYIPRIMSIAFSPDGAWIAAGTDRGRFAVWDVKTGVKLTEKICHARYIDSLVFAPDGALLATALGWPEDMVELWDTETWRPVKILRVSDMHGTSLSASTIAFGTDGFLIAVGTSTRKVRRASTTKEYPGRILLWQIGGETFERLGILGSPKGTVGSLAFAVGSQLLLATHEEANEVILWDLRIKDSPQCVIFPKEYYGRFADISSNGAFIAVNKGDIVTLWRLGERSP